MPDGEIGISNIEGKIFVGIDLSYSSTGLVLISEAGIKAHTCKAGEANQEFAVRAKTLWTQIRKLLPEPSQAIIALEGASYASEFNAFMLGELAGAIKLCLFEAGYTVELVPPTVLKKFATGTGNASKEYVGAQIALKWGFTHKSNDVVDAYGLAKYIEAKTKGELDESSGNRVKNKSKKKSKGERESV